MATELLTILRNIGITLYDAFVLPGDFLVSQFVAHAPDYATSLGIANQEPAVLLRVILSLLSWFLLVVAVSMLLKLLRNAARIVGSMVRTASFRISLAVRSNKTKLVLKLRQLLPQRAKHAATPTPMVEFDDLDLAVLRSASARGPGFALSAPELASQFTLRPAQVQRSLDKLNKNKMLDYVIGSTDGFDNYRLTDSGAAFVAMWQRQGSGA